MNILFVILCIIHVLIWAFVLFAFINEKTAYYNAYFVIPFIYLVQILPFHIIISLKSKIYHDEDELHNKEDEVYCSLLLPHLFIKLSKIFENFSFYNPISPQGMLIFGLITSIYRLKKYNTFNI